MSNWRPMNSAPQDGSPIIVSVGTGVWNSVGAAYWTRAIHYAEGSARADEPAGWRWASDGRKSGLINREPDAWMPMPEPPETLPVLEPAHQRFPRSTETLNPPPLPLRHLDGGAYPTLRCRVFGCMPETTRNSVSSITRCARCHVVLDSEDF